MPDSLFDAMQGAVAPPEEEAPEELAFSGDVQYHERAFAVEQALRSVGALPSDGRERMPYDPLLRKLIMSVSVE